jgi:5-(carboxyamino)imidazole ribonucleotide synthase
MMRRYLIRPGSTLGVFGGGQLGRMFAQAAQQLGYRVHVYAPEADPPAARVADFHTVAAYDDRAAVARFARSVAAVTYEFENIPGETLFAAEKFAPVRPGPHVLATTQNRLREKTFLAERGLPVTPFAPVRSLPELEDALRALGTPAVLKTAAWGYDGKGQVKIGTADEAPAAWDALATDEAICETFIDFTAELSVVAARDLDGATALYGPLHNTHANHILDTTVVPAGLPADVVERAAEITRGVLDAFDVVGVICVEYFLLPDGRLLINEIAPRPHNSGHLTIDAHVTSQFEQQVRALAGLPLGSAELRSPAAMANLLGDVFLDHEPAWSRALSEAGVRLHLYGKDAPRPGRKMGHLTVLADTPEEALERARAARDLLRTPEPRPLADRPQPTQRPS